MECTQKLECTQDLYGSQFSPNEKKAPEQIGFLGICGKKYPVKKGPNKIGRDPQTCNIVLNFDSISRQHAVINVLHGKQFMLMDLDSANKTKLLGTTLCPYVPQPLSNGDMVQFGDKFGIFRLNEEQDDLPMTQAIDIPETPVQAKHVSRFVTATTVPESPDVSDKDDSFIVSSQPKGETLKNNHKFVKPGKTISILPIGSKKIDNIFWNSSKKSTSLNLDESGNSFNDSVTALLSNSENVDNIHEMDTEPQLVEKRVDETDGIYSANTQMPSDAIYTANTQIPDVNSSPSIHVANSHLPDVSPSIYMANTQMPGTDVPHIHTADTQQLEEPTSPNINSLNTQMPTNLPKVCEVTKQQDLHFNIHANKENDNSIYNADTQMVSEDLSNISRTSKSNEQNTESDDEILFNEIDRSFDDNMESQAILTEDIILPSNRLIEPDVAAEIEPLSQIPIAKSSKRNMRINSDESTDCEDIDIVPTQKIPEIKLPDTKTNDEDDTDCEDEMIELNVDSSKSICKDDIIFEDLPTQVITVEDSPVGSNTNLEDMPTQALDTDVGVSKPNTLKIKVDFEDLPTQALEEDISLNKSIQKETESPFKIPFEIALQKKGKKKEKTPKKKVVEEKKMVINVEDENYYQNTQEIFEDLCTQRIPEAVPENFVVNEKNINFTHKSKPNKLIPDTPLDDTDSEEKVNNFVSNLSSQDVREVIGVEVSKPRKMGSDSSDGDVTPKKIRPFMFMDSDLPNSQEIKISVSQNARETIIESSSDSDSEQQSEEQNTPIVFHKKRKHRAKETKIDLTKVFAAQALPTRVMTRVRRPNSRLKDAVGMVDNLLKPRYVTEQEEVDSDIISENLTRLKLKNEKSKIDKDTTEVKSGKKVNEKINDSKTKEPAKEKTENKVNVTKMYGKLKEMKNSPSANKNIHSTSDSKVIETKRSSGNNNVSLNVEPKKRGRPRKNIEDKTLPSITKDSSNDNNNTKTEPPKKGRPRRSKTKEEEKQTDSQSNDENKGSETLETSTSKTRSTRNVKNKDKNTELNKSNQDKADRSKEVKKETEKRSKMKKKEVKESSPIKEVRRSKRQKPKAVEAKTHVKSILKKSMHEESAVYNLSSRSNEETPKNLKRSALSEVLIPSPKRSRNIAGSVTRPMKTQHVLFTAFPHVEVKTKLIKLGAVIVTDVMESTVLLTLQIKRTFKTLCAVGLGKPIVGPNWVQGCADANMIVDPWQYLIKDEAAEKRFQFNLEKTLTGKRNFLRGYNLSSTPNVMPNAIEMKLIVECSGGNWREGGPSWICLTCAADSPLWPSLKARGATLVTTEFILEGVLKQKLDLQKHSVKL